MGRDQSTPAIEVGQKRDSTADSATERAAHAGGEGTGDCSGSPELCQPILALPILALPILAPPTLGWAILGWAILGWATLKEPRTALHSVPSLQSARCAL